MFNSSIKFLPTKRFNENNTKINTSLINFIKLQIKLEINWRKEKRWLTMEKLEKGEGIGGVVVVVEHEDGGAALVECCWCAAGCCRGGGKGSC